MKVQITRGTFGHRVGERVVPIRKENDPIVVDDEIGNRLIAQGVAVKVEDPSEPESVAAVERVDGEVDEAEAFPEFDATMTRATLEEIALSVGIEQSELDAAAKKGDVIALLETARAEYEAGADAPTFDPAGDML